MALLTDDFAVDVQQGDPIVISGNISLIFGIFHGHGAFSKTTQYYYISDWTLAILRAGGKIKKNYVINNDKQRVAKISEESMSKNMLDRYREMKFLLQKNGKL